MSKNKHVIVTGGAGFIGSHSVDLLLSKGYQVTVLDNLSSGKKSNLPLENQNLRLIVADIRDFEAVSSAMEEATHVLHLAAEVSVVKSVEQPHVSFDTNVNGFINILRAIKQTEKPIRLVYASSAAVYGNTNKIPCHIDDHLEPPMSPYALDKAANEHYAKLYDNLYNTDSLGLRYFNVYGPKQDPNSSYAGVISKFIDCANKNTPISVFGTGEQIRDFIYVTDIARANHMALESSYRNVLNIATGRQSSLLELIDVIKNVSEKELAINFHEPRSGDLHTSYAHVQKTEEILNYTPEIKLDHGLNMLYSYLQENQ